jgi:hypothetical protein
VTRRRQRKTKPSEGKQKLRSLPQVWEKSNSKKDVAGRAFDVSVGSITLRFVAGRKKEA